MKRKLLSALFFCVLFASVVAYGQGTILPDSCGKDEVRFKVDTSKAKYDAQGKPIVSPTSPETGKAQVVFIENVDTRGAFWTTPTTRFGIDGTWAGANRGSSWFVVSVDPGVHHVCVNWQSDKKSENSRVGMDSFTAEAGKVYYYQVLITRHRSMIAGSMPGGGGGTITDMSFTFSALSDDEGKYRVKASPLSTFTSETETQ